MPIQTYLSPLRAALLALGLLGLATVAQADIVYSSFSPSGGSGYSETSFTIGSVSNTGIAGRFTPEQNYTLTSLEMAVEHIAGINSYRFSLVADNAGLPTGPLVFSSFTSAVDTGINTFAGTGTRLGGTTYWVVMERGAEGTWGGWFLNTSGQTGVMVRNTASGNNWESELMASPAFRINGSLLAAAPEPGTLVLLGLGVGIFGYTLRRRSGV